MAQNFWNALNKNMDEAIDGVYSAFREASGKLRELPIKTKVNLDEGFLTITSELPGVDPKRVDVIAERNQITIDVAEEDDDESYTTSSRPYPAHSTFQSDRYYSFKAEDVHATLLDGLLTITVYLEKEGDPKIVNLITERSNF